MIDVAAMRRARLRFYEKMDLKKLRKRIISKNT
jgi:hypothetical protein